MMQAWLQSQVGASFRVDPPAAASPMPVESRWTVTRVDAQPTFAWCRNICALPFDFCVVFHESGVGPAAGTGGAAGLGHKFGGAVVLVELDGPQ